jgi:hypothetical protein
MPSFFFARARDLHRPSRTPKKSPPLSAHSHHPKNLHRSPTTLITPPHTRQADFGDTVLAVSGPAWDPASSPALAWGEGDTWTGTVAVPVTEGGAAAPPTTEFKLVLAKADGSLVWEEGPNRALALPAGVVGKVVVAEAAWGAPGAVSVAVVAEEEEGAEAEADPAPVVKAAAVVAAAAPAAVDEAAVVVVEEEEEEQAPEPAPAPAAAVVAEEVAAATPSPPPPPTTPATPSAEPTPLARTILTAATGAATLGFTAVLASALAVDVTEVAAVSALAGLGAAAVGSTDPTTAAKLKAAAGAGAAAAGGLAAGVEGVLRSAGLKSFKEQAVAEEEGETED